MKPTSNYMPSQFDLAFIDAIEYLVKNKREHHKFRTAKELLSEMGIAPATYIGIRNKNRGVSKDRISLCINVLTKKYGVSDEWLRYRRGSIMSEPITKEGEKAMSYDVAVSRIKELEIELRFLNIQLADSKKMVELQQSIIHELQKK